MENAIRVMLVDDDDSLRRFLSVDLADYGLDLTCCASGLQALERLRDLHFQVDVVLTDIRMPGMSGIELMECIAKEGGAARPAIICFSAFSDLSPEAILYRGAEAFFPKPAKSEELIGAVMHFAGARRQRLSALGRG